MDQGPIWDQFIKKSATENLVLLYGVHTRTYKPLKYFFDEIWNTLQKKILESSGFKETKNMLEGQKNIIKISLDCPFSIVSRA